MLCHRCEYRLLNLLGLRRGPRYECEVTEKMTVAELRKKSRVACYCYQPVRSAVLERVDRGDPRPVGSGLLAARSRYVGVYRGEMEIHPVGKSQWTAMYKPPEGDVPAESKKRGGRRPKAVRLASSGSTGRLNPSHERTSK